MGKETEVITIPTRDHSTLTGVTADQHHPQAHEASHVTGADLLDLNATSFHNLLRNGSFEIGNPPRDWNLSAAGIFVRSAAQAHIGTYSGELTRVGVDRYFMQDVADYARYQGRIVTLGCWVYATVADRARLRLSDGVGAAYSAYHTGGSTWEWLTVSLTIAGAATQVRSFGYLDTGDTVAYYDGMILVEGSLCPAFSPNPTENDAVIVHKTADEVVNNSIVMQNDDDLVFPVAVNEIWEFLMILRTLTPTVNPDIDIAFVVPAGGAISEYTQYTGAMSNTRDATAVISLALGAATDQYKILRYVYAGGANAGNVQLQWAQTVAVAEDTAVLENSFIIAHRLG